MDSEKKDQRDEANESNISLLTFNTVKDKQPSSDRQRYQRENSQERFYNVFKFRFNSELNEFNQENFKEQILGNEIKREEVTEILHQIRSRFVEKDPRLLVKLAS